MFGRIVSAIVLALGILPTASAQLHKDTLYGFQFKAPKDFGAIALKPNERITVAKYQSEQKEYGKERGIVANSAFEIRFYPASLVREGTDQEAFVESLWEDLEKEHGYSVIDKEKSIKVSRAPAVERYILPDAEDTPIAVYAAILPQEDGVFVFKGVAIKDRFSKYASEFSKSTRSFKRIEKEDRSERDAELSQMDSQERFLQNQIEKLQPGWDHLRTARYLFLYNADKDFVKELAKQIEVIRDKYQELYPPDKPIDAVSIVRVCATRDEYLGYGGPKGTGGYWLDRDKELVIFDDPPRDKIRGILNHEAFHQYIYYFYGELAPHSWYNEGTGDYFAGADMTKTYRIKGFGDPPSMYRLEVVKEACRLLSSGKFEDKACGTPLRDLMAYTQAQYYDRGGIHYPQGWALIHMLRESKKLQPKWERILDDYLVNLLQAREEVANTTMRRFLEQLEKKEKGSSAEKSQDPKDYYEMADEDEIQARAYELTFAEWTDEDWQAFNTYYLQYVEKEL